MLLPRYIGCLVLAIAVSLACGCGKKESAQADISADEPGPPVISRPENEGIWHLLFLALKSGDLEKANELYLQAAPDAGVDEELEDDEEATDLAGLLTLFDRTDEAKFHKAFGEMCMIHAADNGDLVSVRKLLGEKVSPDATFVYGQTPLHLAANAGDTELASLLLKSGADVNRKGVLDMTPLYDAAANSDSPDMVKLLLDNGADPKASIYLDEVGSFTVLQAAADAGNPEIIKLVKDALAKGE